MFRELIQRNSNLTVHRYFRLLFMATLEIGVTIPFASAILYLNLAKTPIYSYKGLADLHFDFNRIDRYPQKLWVAHSPLSMRNFAMNEGIVIGCAINYFLLFGLTKDARNRYTYAITFVARAFHARSSTNGASEMPM